MKFFVDTADVYAIRDLADTGLVDGVTTNPSLIAKSGQTVVLSEDRIGPIEADTVLVDFAATDEGQEVLFRLSRRFQCSFRL